MLSVIENLQFFVNLKTSQWHLQDLLIYVRDFFLISDLSALLNRGGQNYHRYRNSASGHRLPPGTGAGGGRRYHLYGGISNFTETSRNTGTFFFNLFIRSNFLKPHYPPSPWSLILSRLSLSSLTHSALSALSVSHSHWSHNSQPQDTAHCLSLSQSLSLSLSLSMFVSLSLSQIFLLRIPASITRIAGTGCQIRHPVLTGTEGSSSTVTHPYFWIKQQPCVHLQILDNLKIFYIFLHN